MFSWPWPASWALELLPDQYIFLFHAPRPLSLPLQRRAEGTSPAPRWLGGLRPRHDDIMTLHCRELQRAGQWGVEQDAKSPCHFASLTTWPWCGGRAFKGVKIQDARAHSRPPTPPEVHGIGPEELGGLSEPIGIHGRDWSGMGEGASVATPSQSPPADGEGRDRVAVAPLRGSRLRGNPSCWADAPHHNRRK